MKKYHKNCQLIRHGLSFFEDRISSCCYSPIDQIDGQNPPSLFSNYNGEIITKEQLFSRIDEFSSIFVNGETPFQCKGCFKIEEKDWELGEERKFIDFITLSHYTICNAACVYCSNNQVPEERVTGNYDVFPILKSFKDSGVLKDGFELHLGGGEFSIYRECDAILEEFGLSGFAKCCIATSGIKYVDNFLNVLALGKSIMVVSLDSGCRETYKRIKRVDAFDKVVENLKKYCSNPVARDNITLKYILIPTINDNLTEFKKFLDIAKMLEIKYIAIDIEARYLRTMNNEIEYYYYELANKMREVTKSYGCFWDIYFHSFLQQTEEVIKQYKNKPFYGLFSFIKSRLNSKKIAKLYTVEKYI